MSAKLEIFLRKDLLTPVLKQLFKLIGVISSAKIFASSWQNSTLHFLIVYSTVLCIPHVSHKIFPELIIPLRTIYLSLSLVCCTYWCSHPRGVRPFDWKRKGYQAQ